MGCIPVMLAHELQSLRVTIGRTEIENTFSLKRLADQVVPGEAFSLSGTPKTLPATLCDSVPEFIGQGACGMMLVVFQAKCDARRKCEVRASGRGRNNLGASCSSGWRGICIPNCKFGPTTLSRP